MAEPICIDGSYGEGGGQILRTSLALAAILKQPVRIDNIRASRKKSGLKTQHLAGALALAEITGAEVSGAELHSKSLLFTPKTLRGGRYRFEISTAGSACMLLGTVLPPLLFAAESSEITITGGTHVPFSPPFDFLDRVFLPLLRKLGAAVQLELKRWGFYPKGGGEIKAYVKPCRGLQGLQLKERGSLQRLNISACSANLPGHIAQREIAHLEACLADYRGKTISNALASRALCPGNFVSLEAEYVHTVAGFNGLGKRGKPAEEVASGVCRDFIRFDRTGATVDQHLADQIILYMALAHGDSFFLTPEITSHLQTNINVIRRFLPVNIKLDRTSGAVQITGAGKAIEN
ncbi:MAG: RNA 3'-terminal phosphate cyclase [Deltaproteobacteria bacterium]|jgi:RNA 3'-terminal phosphate cyclase (ATP)|nr:RNA 3'-terminal phosphate cyclase [Deltaproteobacteria bacterium]